MKEQTHGRCLFTATVPWEGPKNTGVQTQVNPLQPPATAPSPTDQHTTLYVSVYKHPMIERTLLIHGHCTRVPAAQACTERTTMRIFPSKAQHSLLILKKDSKCLGTARKHRTGGSKHPTASPRTAVNVVLCGACKNTCPSPQERGNKRVASPYLSLAGKVPRWP